MQDTENEEIQHQYKIIEISTFCFYKYGENVF
jgi:hypothetical protein